MVKPQIFGRRVPGVRYRPRPAAYAVAFDGDGRVAAVAEGAGFFLPGGGSNAGETPEDTVMREVREELGRDLRILGRLGEAVQFFAADEGHYEMNATFFLAELAGNLRDAGEHPLCWLEPVGLEAAYYHSCHAWAVLVALQKADRQGRAAVQGGP